MLTPNSNQLLRYKALAPALNNCCKSKQLQIMFLRNKPQILLIGELLCTIGQLHPLLNLRVQF